MWDRDLQEKLLTLSEKHLDVLASICPSAILDDMREVYAGNRGTTPQKAQMRAWFENKPSEFLNKLAALETEYKKLLETLVRTSARNPLSPEGESDPARDDDGGIEQVEEWLKLWGEEHQ